MLICSVNKVHWDNFSTLYREVSKIQYITCEKKMLSQYCAVGITGSSDWFQTHLQIHLECEIMCAKKWFIFKFSLQSDMHVLVDTLVVACLNLIVVVAY